MSFRFQIFICLCFLFLYGSAVCYNELSTFAILKFQAKLCPLIPSVDNSCFNWTLPASYYQLSSHWDVWIELLLMKLKFGQKGNNVTNLTFYRTRVRSLAMLVTNWLPNWLTHSVTFSRLAGCEWCQLPGDVVTVFWCLVEILKLMLGRDSKDLIKVCVWTCDMNSGSLFLWECFSYHQIQVRTQSQIF